MPRIPQFVPRVSPNVGQSPGYSAQGVTPMRDATGSQLTDLGKGLEIAGLGIARAQDHIDDVAAQTTYNQFDEELSKLEAGNGLKQGKEAMDSFKSTMDEVAALREKFEESLSGRQRSLFARKASVRQGDSTTRIGAHVAQQTKVANIGSLEAGAKGSFRNYQSTLSLARSIGNEDARAEQEAVARSYLDAGLKQQEQAAAMRGDTPEMQAERRAAALDEQHLDAVVNMVDDHPADAQNYLNAHRGEMSEGAIRRAEHGIKNAAVADISLKFMFRAEVQAAKKGGTTLQQQDYALATADASYKAGVLTAEQYDASVRRIEHRFMVRRSEDGQRLVDTYNSAEKFLVENKTLGPDALDSATKTALQAGGKWDNIVSFAKNGRIVNDDVLFSQVQGMTAADHLKLSDEEFVSSLKGRLSEPLIQQMITKRNALLGRPMGGDFTTITQKDMENQAARQLGVLPSDRKVDPDSAQLDAMDAFRLELQQTKLREEAIRGKKLTDEEYKKLLDERVIKERGEQVYVESDSWFDAFISGLSGDTHNPLVQEPLDSLSPERKLTARVLVNGLLVPFKDVPPWFVKRATIYLHEQGRAATSQAIAEQWMEQKQPTVDPVRR